MAGVYNLEALKLGLCLVLNAEDFIFSSQEEQN